MEYKWENLKLEEIGRVVGGGTPSTKVESYYGGNIPWITPKDLSGYTSKYIYEGERSITEDGLNNSGAKLLPKGTVLFSSRAPIGYLAIAGQKVSTNQGFKSIIPNDKTTSEFLYYLLIYNTEKIKNQGSGSTFNEVSGKVMKNIEVLLPPLEIQKKISCILYNLDKKIEINNKIIANLEAQAQAIFKSWFVDFEPFQDGNFVESELGLIPEGWEVLKLNQISKVVTGKTPSTKVKEYYGDKIPFITIPDMHNNVYITKSERYLSNKGETSQIKKTIPKDCICVSCIATVGLVSLTSQNSQTNQQINSVLPNQYFYLYYLYLTLVDKRHYLNSIGSSGSTTKNINKGTFEALNILKPEDEILKEFHERLKSMFKLILNLQLQNDKLAQTRDTLLPKLMSGEIDVSNIKIDDEDSKDE